MLQKKIRLGDLLVEKGKISPEQLETAVNIHNGSGGLLRLGQVLIQEKMVEEEVLLGVLAEQLQVAYLEPGSFEADMHLSEPLQLSVLRRCNAVPIDEQEHEYVVVFADPLDFAAQDTMQRLLPQKPIRIAVTKQNEIDKLLGRLETAEGFKEILADIRREVGNEQNLLKEAGEESGVYRLITTIIRDAVRKKASDIHIEPFAHDCHVRFRIDGFLQEFYLFDLDIYPPLISRIKLFAGIDIAERRKPQDGRFSMEVEGNEYDFRLSTLPIAFGESVVMRILDKSKALIKLEAIGFSDRNVLRFRKGMAAPYGIVLVTGPTGSGKTTTLYAGLNEIKNVDRKIITVEDPIEYRMNLIQQVQVNEKVELTFANALRSILRQDPDVIMIGEIRDYETLAIAVQAALTGHLVFSTLHTNDAISAVTRIVDMGIEPFLVANAMVALQAQRLVRRVCPHCMTPVTLPEETLEAVMPYLPSDYQFVKGAGCKRCGMTGYQGRTIISEVLEISDTINSKNSPKQRWRRDLSRCTPMVLSKRQPGSRRWMR